MATIAPPVPEPEPQASLSPVARIFGVFFSPKATFEDIARKPSWVLPFAIMALTSLTVAVGLNQRMNWREYVAQQMEKSPQASQMSAERKDEQIETGAKFARILTYALGVPAPIVLLLVVALLLWGAYNILAGVNAGYARSLSIVSHAYLPAVVGNILFLIVLFLKDPGTIDLANPVATNLAVFFPENSPKWLEALGKNVDIFILWIVFLIAAGFAATNPKKLKGGKSYGVAFGLFSFYVLIRVVMAFAFS